MSAYDDVSLDPHEPPPTILRNMARTWPITLVLACVLFIGARINESPALMYQSIAVLFTSIWLFTVWDIDDRHAWKDATVFVSVLAAVLMLGAGLCSWVGAL